MSNYIQKFNTQADYDAAEHDYPNTSYVVSGDTIIFAESAPSAFGGLTVKYNVVDPSVEITLFNGGGGSSGSESSSDSESGGGGALPSRMIVDGNEETPINTWRFETAGEHIVQYEFSDNVVPQGFLINNPIYTEVIVGDDIVRIDAQAFYNARTEGILVSATIGTGITYIGAQSFNGNASMTSVTIKAFDPPTLDTAVFYTIDNYPIYVPASVVDTYKNSTATGWSEYASRIEAIQ